MLRGVSLSPARSRLAAVIAGGLCVMLASGCASLGGASPDPKFGTVAVVTRGQSEVDLEADSTMKNALIGGGAGAVSGGLVGGGAGAVAGIGSGPFAFILVPTVAAAGAVAGVAVGGTAGIVVGGLQGLPAAKAEQVTQALGAIGEGRDFQGELRAAVEAGVPAQRSATMDRSDAVAVLQLTELELEQHLQDKISIRVRAKMSLEWGPDPNDRHDRGFDYEFETTERHVDEWLVDDGQAFAASLNEALDTITRDMLRDMLTGTAP